MGTGGGGAGVSCGSSRTGQKMVAQQWWVRGWDQGWWDLEHGGAKGGNRKKAPLLLAVSDFCDSKTGVRVSRTEPTNHEQQSAGGEEKSRRKDV